MEECKIIAAKNHIELEKKINNYLKEGWKIVNCFVDSDMLTGFFAVLVK